MDKKELLERFLLDDTLTPADLETIIGWLEDGSLDDVFSEKLNDLKPVFDSQQTDWDSSELKNKLFQRIVKGKTPSESYQNIFLSKFGQLKQLGIAASVLVVFGLGLLLYKNQPSETNHESEVKLNTLVTKTNPRGIKTVIKLQDGSAVYLNAESSISYPVDFIADRTITLTGEAFFEVAQGHSSAFKVMTNGIETVAMGTSFNIKFYEEFPLEVVLATGKVNIGNPNGGENINLLPGEGIKFNQTSLAIEKFDANIQQSTYWKEGTLHLDKLGFYHLTKTLERWYGVTITVNGKMPTNGSFSGIFSNNETLINVLEAMKFAYQFEYQLNDKSLTIDFKIT